MCHTVVAVLEPTLCPQSRRSGLSLRRVPVVTPALIWEARPREHTREHTCERVRGSPPSFPSMKSPLRCPGRPPDGAHLRASQRTRGAARPREGDACGVGRRHPARGESHCFAPMDSTWHHLEMPPVQNDTAPERGAVFVMSTITRVREGGQGGRRRALGEGLTGGERAGWLRLARSRERRPHRAVDGRACTSVTDRHCPDGTRDVILFHTTSPSSCT